MYEDLNHKNSYIVFFIYHTIMKNKELLIINTLSLISNRTLYKGYKKRPILLLGHCGLAEACPGRSRLVTNRE